MALSLPQTPDGGRGLTMTKSKLPIRVSHSNSYKKKNSESDTEPKHKGSYKLPRIPTSNSRQTAGICRKSSGRDKNQEGFFNRKTTVTKVATVSHRPSFPNTRSCTQAPKNAKPTAKAMKPSVLIRKQTYLIRKKVSQEKRKVKSAVNATTEPNAVKQEHKDVEKDVANYGAWTKPLNNCKGVGPEPYTAVHKSSALVPLFDKVCVQFDGTGVEDIQAIDIAQEEKALLTLLNGRDGRTEHIFLPKFDWEEEGEGTLKLSALVPSHKNSSDPSQITKVDEIQAIDTGQEERTLLSSLNEGADSRKEEVVRPNFDREGGNEGKPKVLTLLSERCSNPSDDNAQTGQALLASLNEGKGCRTEVKCEQEVVVEVLDKQGKEEYSKTLDEKNAEIKTLTEKVDELKAELKESNHQRKTLEFLMAVLDTDNGKLYEQIDILDVKLKKAYSKIKDLQTQLNDTQVKMSGRETIKNIDHVGALNEAGDLELESFRKHQKLRIQLAKEEQGNISNADDEATLKRLVKKTADVGFKEKVTALLNKCNESDLGRKTMECLMDSLDAENAKLYQRIDNLDAQLKKSHSEIRNLKEKLNETGTKMRRRSLTAKKEPEDFDENAYRVERSRKENEEVKFLPNEKDGTGLSTRCCKGTIDLTQKAQEVQEKSEELTKRQRKVSYLPCKYL